jgi:hypothetical protein
MFNPDILTSAVISAMTGIGDESAASNLSFVAFGLTVYELLRMRRKISPLKTDKTSAGIGNACEYLLLR